MNDKESVQIGQDSIAKQGTASMQEAIVDLGLTMAVINAMAGEPSILSARASHLARIALL